MYHSVLRLRNVGHPNYFCKYNFKSNVPTNEGIQRPVYREDEQKQFIYTRMVYEKDPIKKFMLWLLQYKFALPYVGFIINYSENIEATKKYRLHVMSTSDNNYPPQGPYFFNYYYHYLLSDNFIDPTKEFFVELAFKILSFSSNPIMADAICNIMLNKSKR
ncbi:MAG: hypothetical protein QXF76_02485 [Candidatus Anstonellales archaeon]